MSPTLRGALFALLAFGIFATHDVVVKFLGGAYSPFQIVFFSVLFGFPLITLQLLRDRTAAPLRPVHPWWSLTRAVAGIITGVAAFYAFSVLPLAQTYAILFASPLLITLLAIPMLGETVGWRRGGAVLVGLAGVVVVLRPGETELSLGHAAALVAACFGAINSIIMRKIGQDERSVVMILYPMAGNFLVMGAALPFVYEPMPGLDLLGSAVMAALAVAATACLVQAYRTAPAVIVAPMQYSQIIWATIFGLAIFGESLDLPTVIGSAIIIGSGVYIVLREDRGGGSTTTPVLRTRSRSGVPGSPRVSPFLDPAERGPQAGRTNEETRG